MTKEQLLKSNTLLLQKLFTVEAQKAATDQNEELLNNIKEVIDSRAIITGSTFKVVKTGLIENVTMTQEFSTPEDIEEENNRKKEKADVEGYEFNPLPKGYYYTRNFTFQGAGSVGNLLGKSRKDMRIQEQLKRLRFERLESAENAYDKQTWTMNRCMIECNGKVMTNAKFNFIEGLKELSFNCFELEYNGSKSVFLQLMREDGSGSYQELRPIQDLYDIKENGCEL